MSSIDGVTGPPAPAQLSPDSSGLAEAARKLEAAFLAEMLKASKFGETPTAFGGGIGEDQFASFLRDGVAADMVEAGGIGLAERLFESMARAESDGG